MIKSIGKSLFVSLPSGFRRFTGRTLLIGKSTIVTIKVMPSIIFGHWEGGDVNSWSRQMPIHTFSTVVLGLINVSALIFIES